MTVVLRSDLIILALFVTAEQVGQFAAAQFLMVAMYLGAWLFGSIVLPQFTRLREHPIALDALARRWARLFAAVLIPATLVLILVAPFAVRQMFGPEYAHSARLLTLLLLATPFVWLNSLYLHRAIALEDRNIHARIFGAAMILAAGASALLAYKWGGTGIAVGAVARESGLFAVLATRTAGRS